MLKMFEWIKRIFGGRKRLNFELPIMKNKVPMPSVKPPLTEGSMLHAVKEDKGRTPMRPPPSIKKGFREGAALNIFDND